MNRGGIAALLEIEMRAHGGGAVQHQRLNCPASWPGAFNDSSVNR